MLVLIALAAEVAVLEIAVAAYREMTNCVDGSVDLLCPNRMTVNVKQLVVQRLCKTNLML